MRGTLIQVFEAELARLDTAATAAAGRYDPIRREVIYVDTDGDGIGDSGRSEAALIKVPCQVGSRTWEALRMRELGNAPDSQVVLYFHFEDLERLALVDATTGRALIVPGDRLTGIYDQAGSLVQSVLTPPGLYVTRAEPAGWGICMAQPTRNLLKVTFGDRAQTP